MSWLKKIGNRLVLGNVPIKLGGLTDAEFPDEAVIKRQLDKATEEHAYMSGSDLTTAISAGNNVGYFDTLYDGTVESVRATLLTAQASGNIFTVNIKKNGTTILSTLITIDNTATTSKDAAALPEISVVSFVEGDRFTADIDQIGDGTAKGLVIMLTLKKA
jgi:hypothetical protein